MSRAIKVSDRFFRLVYYGSEVFHLSKKDFADKLLDSHLSLIRTRFVERPRDRFGRTLTVIKYRKKEKQQQ